MIELHVAGLIAALLSALLSFKAWKSAKRLQAYHEGMAKAYSDE